MKYFYGNFPYFYGNFPYFYGNFPYFSILFHTFPYFSIILHKSIFSIFENFEIFIEEMKGIPCDYRRILYNTLLFSCFLNIILDFRIFNIFFVDFLNPETLLGFLFSIFLSLNLKYLNLIKNIERIERIEGLYNYYIQIKYLELLSLHSIVMSCPICLTEIKDIFEFKLCRHNCCQGCAKKIKEFSFPNCPICRSDINLQYISLNKKMTLVDKGINPHKVTKKEVMLFTILSQEATKREESNYTCETDSDDD